jgi:hypothetical protein
MSEQILIELIRLVPTVLWVVLAAVVVFVFYRPIRDDLLPRMSGFKAWGSNMPLLWASLERV